MADNAASKRPGDAVDLNEEASPREKKMRASINDVAADLLGEWLFDGCHGLPKDPARARFWLKKVIDGGCEHKHLHPYNITQAAGWLRELDGGAALVRSNRPPRRGRAGARSNPKTTRGDRAPGVNHTNID